MDVAFLHHQILVLQIRILASDGCLIGISDNEISVYIEIKIIQSFIIFIYIQEDLVESFLDIDRIGLKFQFRDLALIFKIVAF